MKNYSRKNELIKIYLPNFLNHVLTQFSPDTKSAVALILDTQGL